jgi:glycosyltransferase involved in cell wall biosynthesis
MNEPTFNQNLLDIDKSTSNVKQDIQVSLVTTCFKDLENLKKTALSVLTQNYPIEWIVIDADSGPETTIFLGSLKSEKHSIIWVSEKDGGIYDGMNKGFLKSSGDVVLFLNAGDLLANRYIIESIIEDYLSVRWLWSVALAVRVNSEGTPRSVWEYLDPELGGLAMGTRTFCHQATFYTRDLLNKFMPYDNSNLAADHLLNLRCFKHAHPRMLTFVSTYFLDGGISSRRPFSASMSDLRRIRKEEDLLLFNSYILDKVVSVFVILGVRAGGIIWGTLRRTSQKFGVTASRKSF